MDVDEPPISTGRASAFAIILRDGDLAYASLLGGMYRIPGRADGRELG